MSESEELKKPVDPQKDEKKPTNKKEAISSNTESGELLPKPKDQPEKEKKTETEGEEKVREAKKEAENKKSQLKKAKKDEETKSQMLGAEKNIDAQLLSEMPGLKLKNTLKESFEQDAEKAKVEREKAEKEYAESVGEKHTAELGNIKESGKLDALDPETRKAAGAELIKKSIKTESLPSSLLDTAKKEIKDFNQLTPEEQTKALLNSKTVSDKIKKALEQFEQKQNEPRTGEAVDNKVLEELLKTNLGLKDFDTQQKESLKVVSGESKIEGENFTETERVLAERNLSDLVTNIGDHLDIKDVPELIKLHLVSNPDFDTENIPDKLHDGMKTARRMLTDPESFEPRQEKETDSQYGKRLLNTPEFTRTTGVSQNSIAHVREMAGSNPNSKLSPLVKFFADIFAFFGIALEEIGLAKGTFWHDYVAEKNEGKTPEEGEIVRYTREQAKSFGLTDGETGSSIAPDENENFDVTNNIPENAEVEIRKVSLGQALDLAKKSYQASPEELKSMRFTAEGKLIKYVIDPPGKQPSSGAREKQFIAVHGTMSYSAKELKRNGGKEPDWKLDSSGLNMGYDNALYQYMVSNKGLVFQFFDDRKGSGCVSSRASRSNTTGVEGFNSKGIGIELSLAGSNTSTTLEKTTAEQLESTKALISSIRKEHNIGAGNVITSADPVRDKNTGRLVNGAHSDDYGAEDRKAMGIASYQSIRSRLDAGKFFSDELSKNGNGEYKKTETNPTVATESGKPSETISSAEREKIINKIKENESGDEGMNGYATWNRSENFPSMGFAHFIWGEKTGFGNSFYEMMQYVKNKGIVVPDNLKFLLEKNPPSTWNGKGTMWADKRHASIVNFLSSTEVKNAGYDFIQKVRIPNVRNKLSSASLKAKFDMLARAKKGPYILTDYVNFKGEGDAGNKSWGLINVLEAMPNPTSPQDATKKFADAAKNILKTRRPKAYEEYGKGWATRIDTYIDTSKPTYPENKTEQIATNELQKLPGVFVGDSLTTAIYGNENDYEAKARKDEYGKYYEIGAHSDKILGYVQNALEKNPKFISILAGTNDVMDNINPLPNIQKMIAAARAKGVPVLLGTLPPIRKSNIQSRVDALNAQIRQLAASDVHIVDYASLSGVIPENGDGIHPDSNGYNKMRNLAMTEAGKINLTS